MYSITNDGDYIRVRANKKLVVKYAIFSNHISRSWVSSKFLKFAYHELWQIEDDITEQTGLNIH